MHNFFADPHNTDMENLSFDSFLNVFLNVYYACAGRAGACVNGYVSCGGGTAETKIRTRGGVRAPDDRENVFPFRPQEEGR